MLDAIDELILSALSKNAKQDLNEMRDYLNDYGYNLNLGEIDTRIKTLEDEKVISGYTISIDTNRIKHKLMRVVLVTFRSSQHLTTRMKVLKKFSDEAPFVLFSGRTSGGYDWITILLSSSTENADEAIFTGIYLEISFKNLRHMTFILQTDLILMRLHILVKNTQSF